MTRRKPTKADHSDTPLTLRWLPGQYAICRLGPHEVIPPWAVNSRGFLCVTRTEDELSVIVDEVAVPPTVSHTQPGWSLLRVVGRLDFAMIGILSRLTAALAEAGVTVLAVSSYDTDYLLVPVDQIKAATKALKRVATVENPPDSQRGAAATKRNHG